MFTSLAGFNRGNKALWLKADAGVVLDGSSKVATWVDQSGNNRNFTASGSGLVVLSNWANSLPAVQNPGTGWYLQHPAFFSGSQLSEAFVVLDAPGAVAQGGWGHFGTNPNGSQYPSNGTRSQIREHYGIALPNAVSVNVSSTVISNPAIYNIQLDSTSIALAFNGGTQAVTSSTTLGWDTTFKIFDGVVSQLCIGEVILYDHILSSSEHTAVYSYLSTRWGI